MEILRWNSIYSLSHLCFLPSGHMVPYNQPVNSYDLITRLTRGRPDYIDQEIPFTLDHYRGPGKQIVPTPPGQPMSHLVSGPYPLLKPFC